MQYARRQRAKGRRPLINSAALPGHRATPTDLLTRTLAQRSPVEITALLGAYRAQEAHNAEAWQRTHGWTAENERASPVVVSAGQPDLAARREPIFAPQ
jgi:hypothetical protein